MEGKRDIARKVGKGQTGLECPTEELVSIWHMVRDYRRIPLGSHRLDVF